MWWGSHLLLRAFIQINFHFVPQEVSLAPCASGSWPPELMTDTEARERGCFQKKQSRNLKLFVAVIVIKIYTCPQKHVHLWKCMSFKYCTSSSLNKSQYSIIWWWIDLFLLIVSFKVISAGVCINGGLNHCPLTTFWLPGQPGTYNCCTGVQTLDPPPKE